MFRLALQYRVAYADTDKMGFVYYGNYLMLFERARTELLRQQGIVYRDLEEAGIALPVVDAHLRYHLPAHYDDLLDVYADVTAFSGIRLTFACQVRRGDTLLTEGEVTLAFMDLATGRPKRISHELMAKVKSLISTEEEKQP